jgi:hypothetical protein
METQIMVGIITACTTVLVAIITQFLIRGRELQFEKLKFKLDRYIDFLKSFAEIGSSSKSYDAHLKISNAINTINLIGSKNVLINIYALVGYTRTRSGDNYSVNEQDQIINKIILSMRKDLGQQFKKEFESFSFQTISPGFSPAK